MHLNRYMCVDARQPNAFSVIIRNFIMRILHSILAGVTGVAIAGAGAASPAAAQSAPYSGYGYSNNGGVVGAVIDSVLGGGRYGTYGQGNDRVAVDQCARAAEARVASDYRPNGYRNYGQNRHDERWGNTPANAARVVGITGVERRTNGLKISGIIDSGRNYRTGYGNPGYGDPRYAQAYPSQYAPGSAQGYSNQAYGYGSPGYNPAQSADMRFSCRVDNRGYVRDVKISRDMGRRGY